MSALALKSSATAANHNNHQHRRRTTMAPAKAKAVSVPQNREQAGMALAEYAALDRAVDQLAILMNEQIAKIKAEYFQKALPLRVKAEEIETALQAFCEANRDQLTNNR